MTLSAANIHFAHGPRVVLEGVDLVLDPGEITVILGPNGCGKSTLLSLLAGLRQPDRGQVTLNGAPLSGWRRKDLARVLAVLPQNPEAPEDIRVRDLVTHGRFAHRGAFAGLSPEDRGAIETALQETGTQPLCDRTFAALSGGERQRVWIALALAQAPRWLLLDEPTSFLDLGHQYHVLSVLQRLNRQRGIGLVMVLHDVNQAGLFADRLVAMNGGGIAADGPPEAVITPELVRSLYGLTVNVDRTETGAPFCIPAVSPLS